MLHQASMHDTSCPLTVHPAAGDMSGGRWGPFWDRLVFSKVRERLGGRVKYMTTGEAAASGAWLSCAWQCCSLFGSLHHAVCCSSLLHRSCRSALLQDGNLWQRPAVYCTHTTLRLCVIVR
jgi:hypothetical protein